MGDTVKDSFLQKGIRGEECSPFIRAHSSAQEMPESQCVGVNKREDRYQQVAQLRGQGLTSKQIAARMSMNERMLRHWLEERRVIISQQKVSHRVSSP